MHPLFSRQLDFHRDPEGEPPPPAPSSTAPIPNGGGAAISGMLPGDGTEGHSSSRDPHVDGQAHHQQQQQQQEEVEEPPQQAGVALIQAPKLEPQPWLRSFVSRLATTTTGTARVDLIRPVLHWGVEDFRPTSTPHNILTRAPRVDEAPRGMHANPSARSSAGGYPWIAPPVGSGDTRDLGSSSLLYRRVDSVSGWTDQFYEGGSRSMLGRVGGGYGTRHRGTRLKLMRHVQLGPVDLGMGINFELDSMSCTIPFRAKAYECLSLKILPDSVIKFQNSWQVPNTGLQLRVMYDCPLNALDKPHRPPARLLIRVDQSLARGLRISPNGIDFSYQRLALGKTVGVRAAGTLLFPRELPIVRGQQWGGLEWKMQRLGVLATW